MTGFELIAGLERIIGLTLLYPRGMSILLGLVPAPSSVEIVQAFPPKQFDHMGIKGMFIAEAERIVLDADGIDVIIKASGGWEHITRTIRQWKNENPADWALVADHISLSRRRPLRENARRLRVYWRIMFCIVRLSQPRV